MGLWWLLGVITLFNMFAMQADGYISAELDVPLFCTGGSSAIGVLWLLWLL